MPDELKSCPFCGASGVAHRVPTGWRVSCESCVAQPRPGYPPDTEAEAIAVWNTRATLTDELTRLREKVGVLTVALKATPLRAITEDTEDFDARQTAWLREHCYPALADQPK